MTKSNKEFFVVFGVIVGMMVVTVTLAVIIGTAANRGSARKCEQIAKLAEAQDWKWQDTTPGCIIVKNGKLVAI